MLPLMKPFDPKKFAAEAARRAAADIHQHGWRQGDYGTYSNPAGGSVCMLGAIRRVTNDGDPFTDNYLSMIVQEELVAWFEDRESAVRIVDWNDVPGRTQEEVEALLLQFSEEMIQQS